MVPTRLILLEGLFGSGKTTTAEWLAELLTREGISCLVFDTSHPEHPTDAGIRITTLAHDYATHRHTDKTLPEWRAFARTTTHSEAVYILEAVFWQCTAMLSLLAGAPVAEILASNRRIIATLAAREPVLIHFRHHNVEGHLRWIIGSRSRWRSLVVPAYSAQAGTVPIRPDGPF
jgi:hypothetical protein